MWRNFINIGNEYVMLFSWDFVDIMDNIDKRFGRKYNMVTFFFFVFFKGKSFIESMNQICQQQKLRGHGGNSK